MLWGLGVAVCVLVSLAEARRSPNADDVLSYYSNGTERISDNILEDASLDVPGLIHKYGYPIEVHQVETEDGYLLELHRIPHGRDGSGGGTPVLLMHGFMCSSADWVVMGPGTSFAYILADAGFDVWLGNARGNYYSKNHTSMSPDNEDFWDFSWDEIGYYDLPAMINYALKATGRPNLHYVGHSQGTTVFFAMASLRPEYNDKIKSMQAFAPVAFLEHSTNHILKKIAPFSNLAGVMLRSFGVHDLLPKNPILASAGRIFCADESIIQPVCANSFFIFGMTTPDMLNTTLLPIKLAHTPAGISTRQLIHFGQLVGTPDFKRYNHGPFLNWRRYRTFDTPHYDLSRITSRIYLHYCDIDFFAHLTDLFKLKKELGDPIMVRVPNPRFTHLDFVWGSKANEFLYQPTLDILRGLE